MKKLAKFLFINSFSSNDWRFFALDVFHAMGGTVDSPVRVGIVNSYHELAKAQTKAEALNREEIFMMYSGFLEKEAILSLRRCGITAVPINNFF